VHVYIYNALKLQITKFQDTVQCSKCAPMHLQHKAPQSLIQTL